MKRPLASFTATRLLLCIKYNLDYLIVLMSEELFSENSSSFIFGDACDSGSNCPKEETGAWYCSGSSRMNEKAGFAGRIVLRIAVQPDIEAMYEHASIPQSKMVNRLFTINISSLH